MDVMLLANVVAIRHDEAAENENEVNGCGDGESVLFCQQ